VAVGVADGVAVGVGVAVAVCVFVGVAVGVGCGVAVALGRGATLTLGCGGPVAVTARVADGASVATCFRDRGATPKGIKATMAASAKAMAATNQICRG